MQVYLGSAIVVASLDPNVEIRPDEPVWVAFDQDRVHLFVGETQPWPSRELFGHDKSGLQIRSASFEASFREAPQDEGSG